MNQDEEIGRLYRTRKQETEQLKKLKDMASQIGEQLGSLGYALKNEPQNLSITAGNVFMSFQGSSVPVPLTILNADGVAKLINEIIAAEKRLAEITKDLKEFGLE